MPSSTLTNPQASSPELNRNKPRKKGVQIVAGSDFNTVRWRSDSDQRIYASKLIDALSQVHPTTISSPFAGGKAVRETADRVLAVMAKGKTRWSRTILTGRLSFRLSKKHKHKKPRIAGDNINRLKKTAVIKRLPAFQKKVRVLSRLIPGCRKTSFPSLLEEAIDYIAVKQMQVRAMTLLSELLTPTVAPPDNYSIR